MSKESPEEFLNEDEEEMLSSINWDEIDKQTYLMARIVNELREFNHHFDEFARMIQGNTS